MHVKWRSWARAGVAGGCVVLMSCGRASTPSAGSGATDRGGESTHAGPSAQASTFAPTVAESPPASGFLVKPTLESERERQEGMATGDGASELQIDFPGGFAPNAVRLSDTHFLVDFAGKSEYMFCFRLNHVKNKTVRVDLKGVPLRKWCTLNPVYSYGGSALNDLSPALGSELARITGPVAQNGAILPDTSDCAWHFISDVWAERNTTLSFVQHYDQDSVLVAMKVPFQEEEATALCDQVRSARGASVVKVGESAEGRPLWMIELLGSSTDAALHHPTILMYAREHADEHDSSWAVAGAVRWLTSNSGEAAAVREKYNFLLIPLLDPDAAAHSVHESVIYSFTWTTFTPEALAYTKVMKAWIDGGHRLDLVLDMHNLESAEAQHLECPSLPPATDWSFLATQALYTQMRGDIASAGYLARDLPGRQDLFSNRFGGWLSATYSPVFLMLELDSQQPKRHLTVTELGALGGRVVGAAADFLESAEGQDMLREIDGRRAAYAQRWKKAGGAIETDNPLIAEHACLTLNARASR